ncbi:hypothetical protein DS891_14605 [Pseudoalteromonas sp. JC28]|nr:hypothetical protein [Pseudoalteromonas sp. JC28]NSY34772.1 hypothetical protein [Pseudoalteromonas sp. JC28]
MLSLTVDAGLKSNIIKPSSLREVVLDSTIMEKNITHPTDNKLLEKCRDKLVGFAKQAGIRLRQSHERVGPKTAQKVARYAHAKQFKRMKKLKSHTLRSMVKCFEVVGKTMCTMR